MRRSIPVDRAWVRWGADRTLNPPIRVIEIGEEIDNRYFMSWGCASGDFVIASSEQRVTLLFAKMVELILWHGFKPEVVHGALLPIREYRAHLLGNLTPDTWYDADHEGQ